MAQSLNMKILVTGSSGLIGRSLGDFLEKKGIAVLSYDPKVDAQDDILDFQRLKEKIKGVDGVVHLAAVTRPQNAFEAPKDCVKINIGGTANVLEAARQNKKENSPWVIFISSRDVFGEPKSLPLTEDAPKNPQNLYGLTKAVGEELCRIFSESYGLKTRVLRFTSVYGGADGSDRVVAKFIGQASRNEPLTILGTGREVFDFTHVDDIVQGIWQCIGELVHTPKPYDDFILSYGQPVSLEELAQVVIKETSSKSRIIFKEARQLSTVKSYASSEKARKLLGFDPKININQGIKLAIKELK